MVERHVTQFLQESVHVLLVLLLLENVESSLALDISDERIVKLLVELYSLLFQSV